MVIEKMREAGKKRFTFRFGIILLISLFLLNVFLILSKITPSIFEINPYDGAKYIESGHLLLIWGPRDLSWGPLVSVIYALLDLFVSQSPNWFLLEAWAGNLILFGLLWFGLVHLAKNLKAHISPLVIIGLLFSLVVFFPILENQSDALFLFFSMMAVANLNSFRKTGRLKNVILASLMVGLGVLCRVETILLFAPLLAFSLIFNRKRQKIWKVLLAVSLPMAGALALYAVVSLLTIGYIDWGVGNKSIESFDMNHAFIPGSKLEQAYLAGESIIGPVEEHQNSVLRILINRPMIFVERAAANLLHVPESFIYFFSSTQGILIAIFSALGIGSLVRKKETGLLALLLVWPLHALVSLIFLPRHIIAQMSFIFIILAAIGVTDLIYRVYQRKRLFILLGLMAAVVIVSGVTQAKALFTAGLILSLVLLLKLVVESEIIAEVNSPHLVFTLLVGSLLVLSPGFEFPARLLGQTDDERAIYQLQEDLPEQSNVLASVPIVPVAARMVGVGYPRNISDSEAYLAYLEEKDIQAIYLDEKYSAGTDSIYQMIQAYPNNFELAYQSADSGIEVYLVQFSSGQ